MTAKITEFSLNLSADRIEAIRGKGTRLPVGTHVFVPPLGRTVATSDLGLERGDIVRIVADGRIFPGRIADLDVMRVDLD